MKRKIRVVQLITGLAIGEIHGGGEMFASRLAQALDRTQVEVTVYCLWKHGTPTEDYWVEELRSQGISVILGESYDSNFRRAILQGFRQSRQRLRRLHPDIIQTHTEPADMIGLLLRMTHSVPCAIRTCHNTVEWSFASHLGRWMDRLCPLIFDCETAVSPAATERLNMRPVARLLGRKALYLPNTIDAQRTLKQLSQRDLRASLGVSTETALLLFVGRLSQQKGVDILLHAMDILHQKQSDIQLWIVGEGEQRSELEQLCRSLGLEGYVSFLGKRTDPADLMRVANLFVLPSRWEGLPTVLMEAMLVGTPIVATNVSGSRDLIQSGRNGWLVRPDDPKSLAQGINSALESEDLRQGYTDQAALDVRTYTIERVATQYIDLYTQLYGAYAQA